MKKFINTTHIEGYIYEHSLEAKVSGPNSKTPGTEFITGVINIATDEKCQNIVPVHYTYVTANTSKGATNANFTFLKNVIDGTIGTVMSVGKENAGKVSIDSAIGLNEFYSDRTGKEELVSAKRNEGGFIRKIDVLNEDEKKRNTFKTDMVITKTTRIEADEEKNLPEKVIVKGCVFDFRGAILPIEYTVTSSAAMDYFEGLEASNTNPVLTCVWGRQISETIVKQLVEESAFGEDSVREVKNTRKDFVITGASKVPMEWDDESTITVEEFTKAIADRETYLATIKQRQDEYKASKNAAATPANSGFNF
jgi:hypothetical protein